MDHTGRAGPSVGVDIGGTRTKAVLWDGTAVLARSVRATPPDVAVALGPAVAAIVADLGADPGGRQHATGRPHPVALGLVVPGLVDETRRIARWSANLGWRDLDVAAALAGHVDLSLSLGHDVRAGLLGEHVAGAARGHDDVLFVPVGTGLASALMLGGRLVRGGSAWSGEIGHVVVDPDGPPCGCGRRGCLEAVAGAAAVERRWRAVGGGGDAADLVAAVTAGDGRAGSVWTVTVEALGTALAPVVLATGIRLLVVGGGLAGAGDLLLDPLRGALAARLPRPALPAVVQAELGDWAGAVGAAELAVGAAELATGQPS